MRLAAPPIIKRGARTPPDVPDPREKAHIRDFAIRMPRMSAIGALPLSSSAILSYPTPNPLGKKSPPTATPIPPSAGHHIQWTGKRSNQSSKAYIMRLMPAAMRPTTAPSNRDSIANGIRSTLPILGMGKSGPGPIRNPRRIAAVALAMATGTRLRGRNSKSRSSTARRSAANGVAKVADIPAAAPATRRVVRSASVR